MSHKNSNTNLKPQNGQTNAHSTKNLRKTENVEIAKWLRMVIFIEKNFHESIFRLIGLCP